MVSAMLASLGHRLQRKLRLPLRALVWWLKMKNPACTAVTREAGRMGKMIAPTCGAPDRSSFATRAEFILAVF